MGKTCLRDDTILKKIGEFNDIFIGYIDLTSTEVRNYNAYECPHCGALYFFRKDED